MKVKLALELTEAAWIMFHLSDYQFYSYTRYIHSNTTYESASVYKEMRVEK